MEEDEILSLLNEQAPEEKEQESSAQRASLKGVVRFQTTVEDEKGRGEREEAKRHTESFSDASDEQEDEELYEFKQEKETSTSLSEMVDSLGRAKRIDAADNVSETSVSLSEDAELDAEISAAEELWEEVRASFQSSTRRQTSDSLEATRGLSTRHSSDMFRASPRRPATAPRHRSGTTRKERHLDIDNTIQKEHQWLGEDVGEAPPEDSSVGRLRKLDLENASLRLRITGQTRTIKSLEARLKAAEAENQTLQRQVERLRRSAETQQRDRILGERMHEQSGKASLTSTLKRRLTLCEKALQEKEALLIESRKREQRSTQLLNAVRQRLSAVTHELSTERADFAKERAQLQAQMKAERKRRETAEKSDHNELTMTSSIRLAVKRTDQEAKTLKRELQRIMKALRETVEEKQSSRHLKQ